jgi:catechol 2,3-dioxygenase-like lactoylglutathione lyase family enzyme
MSAIPTSIGAITLFVEDPRRSKVFYDEVFGLQTIYEDENAATFRLENVLLNLLATSAAGELVEPAAVAHGDSGSRFQLTIWVDDVDAACGELATRGVRLLNGPQDREWGVRTAAFADPDGHVWELAQELSPSGGA